MDTLSLTKEAKIYNGLKTISLTSGAGKSVCRSRSNSSENTDIVSSLPLGGLHASPSLAGTALPQWGPYRSHAGRGPQAYSFLSSSLLSCPPAGARHAWSRPTATPLRASLITHSRKAPSVSIILFSSWTTYYS